MGWDRQIVDLYRWYIHFYIVYIDYIYIYILMPAIADAQKTDSFAAY